MKKSMLNVITLALVLVNLVLTVILTFSLVSTNNKTNKLVTKVSEIIDLDVAGVDNSSKSTSAGTSIEDVAYVVLMILGYLTQMVVRHIMQLLM